MITAAFSASSLGALVIGKSEIHSVLDIPLEIGESPVWDPAAGLLWFVDILAPAVYSLDPTTNSVSRFDMPASVGSLGLARDGELVVALRTGVHLFDPRRGTFKFLVHPEPSRPRNRLNDGRVGPDGAFWVGSMSEARPYEPTGALYRVTIDGRARLFRDDIHVSNGLAWSPDGRIMYHVDSLLPEVRAYQFDGAIDEPMKFSQFAALDVRWGRPDGAAVDVEGSYWSAGVSAGRLNRIASNGQLIESVQLPIAAPTMPCFGGADMKTLYITSLRRQIGDISQPGTLLSMRVDVAGLRSGVFGVGRRG